jgi:hypothetical protein
MRAQMKRLTENRRLALVLQAQIYLAGARECLAKADAPKSLARVRLAQSSIKGALRNRSRFALREATQ